MLGRATQTLTYTDLSLSPVYVCDGGSRATLVLVLVRVTLTLLLNSISVRN